MKVLKWLLMALAGSSDRDICDTALMPDEPKFVNEIDIEAPAEKVWKVMTDTCRYAELPTRLDRVEIIDDLHVDRVPEQAPDPLRFRIVTDERPIGMES